MQKLSGQCNGDLILLHGGAGSSDPKGAFIPLATEKLAAIASRCWQAKHTADPSMSAVIDSLMAMEDDPLFNAGLGAVLQADGNVRLTAAVMQGQNQCFSGVINVSNVRHPSMLALHLQKHDARVLAEPGNQLLARSLQLPVEDNITKRRFEQWYQSRQSQLTEKTYDTVGSIALIGNCLSAGTSTGGRHNVAPGRVSDSATIAGTYCSNFVAVSLTGVGEEIVDDGVAVRLETRVRDGMSLKDACEKTFEEALSRKREYGWIAVSNSGEWCVYYTTDAMPFIVAQKNSGIVAQS